jgi:multidrug efflux pump subunit AcrA (membrane-fusion protein)
VKNNIKGFQVQAIIENPDNRLRPGMSVNLTVPIDRADDAISVPIAAVFQGRRDQEGGLREEWLGDGAPGSEHWRDEF